MEHDIVRFLHSRFGAMLMMVIAVTATIVAYGMGVVEHLPGDTGMWLPSVNDWIPTGAASLTVNLSLNALIAVMLILLNKWFNILRSVSNLFAGMFFIMQMSQPGLAGQFYGGTLLCVLILFSTIVLYCTFNRPFPLQPVYLIFMLLSVGAMTQYAYMFYLPVFLIGCGQMRIFNIKTVLAAGMGMITPVWIMWGLGLVSLEHFEMPHFVNIFTALDSHEALHMLVSVGFTLMLMLVLSTLNMLKVYNYNSKMRAYNGFIAILSVATAILVFVDYTNLAVYVPLLNCCAAFQIGHFFSIQNARRSYIAILAIIAVYCGLYAWCL